MAISEFNNVEFNEAEFNEGIITILLMESITSADQRTYHDDTAPKAETITLFDARSMVFGDTHMESLTPTDVRIMAFFTTKTETVTLADAIAKHFIMAPLDDNEVEMMDALTFEIQLALFDAVFLSPDTINQINGKGCNETIKLAAWLSIKRVGPQLFGD